MTRTNYHLIIKQKMENYYFHHDYIDTGDIVRIGGYRVVVVDKEYDHPYTRLSAKIVNEGEIVIRKEDLR